VKLSREVTEIEQSILDGMIRIVLKDLRLAWSGVSAIEFSIESHETEPQLLQILAPNEAVVAISMEIRIGETAGLMNIGIPSIVVKMLRHKFDQQWSLRKTHSTEDDHKRTLNKLRSAALRMEARLRGPTMTVDALLALQENDLLEFDYPLGRPMEFTVNGKLKYRGEVVTTGRKRAFRVAQLVVAD
jgi:flagellar motor switch protein FliM